MAGQSGTWRRSRSGLPKSALGPPAPPDNAPAGGFSRFWAIRYTYHQCGGCGPVAPGRAVPGAMVRLIGRGIACYRQRTEGAVRLVRAASQSGIAPVASMRL